MELLVAYDIETSSEKGERRLQRVAAVCERFGVRVQYSLFECRLDIAKLESMQIELRDVMDLERDAIDIYRLDRPIPEVRTSLGRAHRYRLGGPWIIVPSSPDLR
jgi:CRISPR-associated protein Cas2